MLPAALDLDPSEIPINQIPAALSALAALQSALGCVPHDRTAGRSDERR
jgi:hypothetical protein